MTRLGGTGYLFLRSEAVGERIIDITGNERFHQSLGSKVLSKLSRPGDTVVTTKGNSTGRAAYINSDYPTFVYSPHLSFWRSTDHSKLHPGFLKEWAHSPEFTGQLNGMKDSTDMAPYLSLTDQRRLEITLPSPREQEGVVRVLGTLGDKIELNRKCNRAVDLMLSALFRSWFVDFDPTVAKVAGRCPIHVCPETASLFPSAFQESELGLIPQGWHVEPVSEIASFINGRAFTKGATGNGRMVIRIAELNSGPGGSTVYNHVDASEENIARPGDLLFAWSGSLDVYRWYRDDALINQHIFKVVDVRYPQWFVHYALHEVMPFFQDIAADKATTMGHIKREHLSQAKVCIPSKEILGAADKIFEPLYAKQLANERESQSLASLRNTLLPNLLTGEIRVKQAEKLAETFL